MAEDKHKSANLLLAICLCIYLLAGIFLIKYYQYQINPDGTSYISIAEKYMHGDFKNAVNGFWGPMISWFIAPLLALGFKGTIAAKIVTLSFGFLTLIGVRLLLLRFEMSDRIRNWMLIIIVPAMLAFAFSTITPDILILCALTYYLFYIFNKKYDERRRNGLICGLLGGLAYLSKSFALPFFSLHFLIFNAIHFIRASSKERRKSVFTSWLLGMATFAVISGLWIGITSFKYGELLFSASAKLNKELNAPDTEGHPTLKWGFLEPTNETAISAWEDPAYFKFKGWSPFDSWDAFKHQLTIVKNNFKSDGIIIPELFPFFLPTILICVLFFLPLNRSALDSSVFYSLLTIGIYCGLYSFVLIIPRFLGIVYILAVLLGGYMLNKLVESSFLSNRRKNLALIIFSICFVAIPMKYLHDHLYCMKWVYDISEKLRSRGLANAKIASNKNWNYSLYIAYYLKCRYYGMAKENVTGEELRENLEKFSIDYYMEWGSMPDHKFLSDFEDVTKGMVPNLRVYKIKP